MLNSFLMTCINWYFTFLEYILWMYLLSSFLLKRGWLRSVLCDLAVPLLYPIQRLMKNSVMQSKRDFSAIISLMVILFIRAFFKNI